MPSIWKLSSISNICTLCIPLYCCYLELLHFNSLNYNPFSQRETDYISAIRCILDMWDQVSGVINDFLIMQKIAKISKGEPSIPFLSIAPTCSSASLCHNRHDHGLLEGSFLKHPSRMWEIQTKIPGFNNTKEKKKSRTLQIPAYHSNLEATGCFVQLSLFLFFRRKSRFEISWKISSSSWEEADSVLPVNLLWDLVRNLLQCTWWVNNLQPSFAFYTVDISYKQGTREEQDEQ